MVTVSIDNCLKSVDLGLEIAERTGIHLLDIPLYQTGAYASLIMGNCQRAEDYLKRMKPFIKPFSYFDIGNCNSIKLSIALMKKNYFAAFKEALNTLRMAFKTESPIPIFLTHIGMAQALLKMASEQIKKAYRISESARDLKCIGWVYLMEAYLQIKKNNHQRGLIISKGIQDMQRASPSEYDSLDASGHVFIMRLGSDAILVREYQTTTVTMDADKTCTATFTIIRP